MLQQIHPLPSRDKFTKTLNYVQTFNLSKVFGIDISVFIRFSYIKNNILFYSSDDLPSVNTG